MVSDAERARVARLGVTPFSDAQGLALFDTGLAAAQPVLVPARLDNAALRAQANAGALPVILSGLVRASARRGPDGHGSLVRRLAGVPEAEWQRIALDLVRGHVAGVLGHASPRAVDPELNFKEMGFDSLAAVELRNRLIQATGLRLPATIVFDHPTPTTTAKQLLVVAMPSARSNHGSSDEAQLRELLEAIPVSRLREAGLLDPLMELARPSGDGAATNEDEVAASIDEMDAEQLIEMTRREAEEHSSEDAYAGSDHG
jgi:polyketide synthase 12